MKQAHNLYPIEEGSTCPECGCGKLEYIRESDCTCHFSAPCSACIDAPLTCNFSGCGWRLGEEISAQGLDVDPDVLREMRDELDALAKEDGDAS